MNVRIRIKKLADDVQLPKYAHPGDAGMDLFSRETRTLEFGEPHLFKLGFATEIPEGYVGLIKDKSSLGSRGITVLGGVIDYAYRGEYGVVLVNTSEREYLIKPGDKIAQLLIVPVVTAELEEVQELNKTRRGDGGFGSTGR